MHRLALILLLIIPFSLIAQNPPASDPAAVSLVQPSIAALTGGVAISDVTLNANVTSTWGSSSETGTATFRASGTSDGRVDLNLNDVTRTDVRNSTNGIPGGAWVVNGGTATPYALHNCWTDAAWFFPALSSLAHTANANFVFKYMGQVQHGGLNTQQVRVFQAPPAGISLFQQLSTIDFYLDPVSLLPSAVAFNVHPDGNAGVSLSVEVDFSNYQVIQGVAVPMHIQRYQQGTLMLDATIQTVLLNQGLSPSVFSIN